MAIDTQPSFAADGINIVFMGNFPYPYGMASTKRVQSFIDYLRSINIIPRVLILRQGGERLSRSKVHGDHYSVRYRTVGHRLHLGANLIYELPLFFIDGCLTLIKWHKRHSSNYLYCYNGLDVENLSFVLFAKALGYHIIFDIVEDFSCVQDKAHFLSKLKYMSWTLLDRTIFEIADGIVVISNFLKNKYERRNNKHAPIQLIPISAKCRERADHKLNSGGIIKFLYAGSFGAKDDILTLIRAFENLQRKTAKGKLLLLGKGGYLQLVKDTIRGNKSIEYIGYLPDEDFYEFLKQADVLCMVRTDSTYANAGFPFKLGEYLATGKPVIASNVGDVSLYLEDGEDVFLVDPGDVNALERVMKYCIDNYAAVVKIGNSGMEKCKTFFNPEVNGKLFLELMKIVQRGKSRKR